MTDEVRDPFADAVGEVGDVVRGRVTKVVPFGVFVEFAEGIEGLAHTSDLGGRSPEVGDELVLLVADVDLESRRVRLAIRAA